jgi:hypothetical protein
MKLAVCLVYALVAGQVDNSAADPFADLNQPADAAETQPAPPAAVPDEPAAAEPDVTEPTAAEGETSSPKAAPSAATVDEPVEAVEVPRPRSEAPQILEAALEPAARTEEGEPLTLVEAFRRSAGQPRQRVARAYWKLAVAMAADQFARSERQDFADEAAWAPASAERTPEDAALLATAAATAAARVNETRLMLTAAQLELADALGRVDPKLPLAADRPHVGAYRTKYDRIFGAGPAPARLRQINRTIPLRAAGIDRRAESVRAAEQAWQTNSQALARGQVDLATALAAYDALVRERRQFLDAVRAYNDDIAEYALAVAGDHFNEPTLVSMLIPAAAQSGQHTPAAPQTFAPGGSRENEAGAAAPSDTAAADTKAQARQTLRPGTAGASRVGRAADATATQFQDLAGEGAPRLAQAVAERLHAEPSLPAGDSERLTLAAFLSQAAVVERPVALAAYWRLVEQVGRYRLFERQLRVLQGLRTAAAAADDPAGQARLTGEIAAVEADLADAQTQLEAAQSEAARVLARTGYRPVAILPVTAPHAGRYQTKLQAQPIDLAASRRVRRAVALVDSLHPALVGHAQALVAAEEARAVAAQALSQGKGDLPVTVDLARQERLKALALLQRLTDYNLAIGDYALAVLPTALPPEQLARSLVIER